MTKIIPIHHRRLSCIFEKDGFLHSRTAGDHDVYTKTGCIRPLIIPRYRAVPVFIIKNLMRTSGMSRERYFELLVECS